MDGTPRLTYLPALDGLRGLAVAAVIAFHAGSLDGGFLGVDAFFVLSGFLITSLLLVEHRNHHRVDLRGFWSRRARRLLPALWLLLAAVSISSLWWATASEAERLRGDAIATVAYVANWHAIAAGQSYWATYETPSPLAHTWSLAIEEQFYLLWPLLVLGAVALAFRRRVGLADAVLGLSVVGIIASLVAMLALYEPGADPSRVYFGTDTRASAILLGAAFAAWLARGPTAPPNRTPWWSDALALVGIGWLAFAWISFDGQDPSLYRGGLLLCGVAVVAVLAASRAEHGVVVSALSWRPLCWLGLISYGLYLWHWPVFVVLDGQRTGLTRPWLLIVQLGVTLALALASYHLLELPVRRGSWPRRRAGAWTAGAFGATTAVIILAGAIAASRSGPSSTEIAESVAPVAATTEANDSSAGPGATDPAATDPGPTAPPPDPIVAATERLGRPPRILIVGDSVAFTLARGLLPFEEQLGLDVESEAVIACGVARGTGRVRLPDGTIATEASACHDWASRWPSAINAFDPDLVLLVVGWPASTERDLDGTWRRPCDPVFDAWYREEVAEALHVLTASGVPVAMTNAAYWRSARAPDWSDDGVDCLNDLYGELIAATPGVAPVDLAGFVCPDPPDCVGEIDGVELRDDGLHFNGPAGTLVGMWVTRQGLAAIAEDG